MPKSKKRKTNHNQSSKGELTHEEIWDDSALIRSWNDAVAEYQFYHSIYAKGEDVNEVLRKYDEDEQQRQQQQQPQPQNQQTTSSLPAPRDGVDIEDGEIEDQPVTSTTIDMTISSDTINPSDPPEVPTTRLPPEPSERAPSTVTAAAIHPPAQSNPPFQSHSQSHSQTQAQTLENMKMAYYWAGYYSGLHDGQAAPQPQPRP